MSEMATAAATRKKAKPKRKILGERERMCVICRKLKGKSKLIRIVLSPNGEFTADATGKSPGRGAYICRDKECISAARKSKSPLKTLLPRNSKETPAIPAGFWDNLITLAEKNEDEP